MRLHYNKNKYIEYLKELTNIPFTKRIRMVCTSAYAARSSWLIRPINTCVTTRVPNDVTLNNIEGNAILHVIFDSSQIFALKSLSPSASEPRSLSSILLSIILIHKNMKRRKRIKLNLASKFYNNFISSSVEKENQTKFDTTLNNQFYQKLKFAKLGFNMHIMSYNTNLVTIYSTSCIDHGYH